MAKKRSGGAAKNELWYIQAHGKDGRRMPSKEASALSILIAAEKKRGGTGFLSAADKVLKAHGFSEIKKTKTAKRKKARR